MVEYKSALTSRGVWGGILAGLPAFGKLLEAVHVVPPGSVDQIYPILVSLAGGVLSIWGRVSATKKISGLV